MIKLVNIINIINSKIWFLLNIKKCKVTQINHEYDGVYTFYLKPNKEFKFKSGQHTHLVIPKSKINKLNVRHMSMASSSNQDNLMFSMDLNSESHYKKEMSKVKVGDTLKLFGAVGELTLERILPGSHIQFIAGGLGMTVFRSIISEIKYKNHPVSFSLIYAGRGYLYKNFIDTFISDVVFTDRAGIKNAVEAASNGNTTYLICGRTGFVDSIKKILGNNGVDESRVISEDFDRN